MKIFIIGSGNVATHLATALFQAQHTIVGVCSRNSQHASLLAQNVEADVFTSVAQIPTDADFYLISISDDNIDDVVMQMPKVSGVVAHTAGSIDITRLSKFEQYGVFYPLQTFTQGRPINVSVVPMCIEANTPTTYNVIENIAKSISNNVLEVSSQQRKYLHLAAVFACNFVNFMYAQAETIVAQSGLPFSIVKPLIDETADKAISIGPLLAQTGPARRADFSIMEKHKKLLDNQNLQKLYSFVSEQIMSNYNQNKN